MKVCEKCGSDNVFESGYYSVDVNVEFKIKNIEFDDYHCYCTECEIEVNIIPFSEWQEKERAKFIGEGDE